MKKILLTFLFSAVVVLSYGQGTTIDLNNPTHAATSIDSVTSVVVNEDTSPTVVLTLDGTEMKYSTKVDLVKGEFDSLVVTSQTKIQNLSVDATPDTVIVMENDIFKKSYLQDIDSIGNLTITGLYADTIAVSGGMTVGGDLVVTGNSSSTNVYADSASFTVTETSVLRLSETTTPVAVTNFGAFYTKSDNIPYFQDGEGNESELTAANTHFGEMSMYESAGTQAVGETAQYYGVNGVFSGQELENFTFVAGSNGSGNITTASGGSAININDVGHGLISGDYAQVQSANHAGTSVVTRIDDDNFTVVIAFVGNEASTWQEGDYLLAGTGAAGKYQLHISFTVGASSNPSKEYKFEPVQNATHIDKSAFELITTSNLHNSGASGCLFTIVDGDRIWVIFLNTQDTQDLNYEHANLNFHRL